MKCRNCGTEIADKAIVCYRCGLGTTEPVRRPASRPSRGGGPPLIAGILPLLLALVALVGAQPSGYPREMDLAAAVLAATGVLLLVIRIARRR